MEYTRLCSVSEKYLSWLPKVIQLARNASLAIMEFYQNKHYQIQTKEDQSPLTEADLKAHEIIEKGLYKIDSTLPILSEEGPQIPFTVRSHWPLYWLVDPLDGTREFIQETGEFTVNIALIENHAPVLGVVVAPALQQAYWALRGGPAFFEDKGMTSPVMIKSHKQLEYPVKMVLSRNHHHENKDLESLINCLGQKVEIYYHGSAIKICLVARGVVDLYPRFGRTGEWDTAAGQCILEAAGGRLVDLQGQPLHYNSRPSLINPSFYAVGCAELLSNIMDKSNCG